MEKLIKIIKIKDPNLISIYECNVTRTELIELKYYINGHFEKFEKHHIKKLTFTTTERKEFDLPVILHTFDACYNRNRNVSLISMDCEIDWDNVSFTERLEMNVFQSEDKCDTFV
jgi:hypothetical protein